MNSSQKIGCYFAFMQVFIKKKKKMRNLKSFDSTAAYIQYMKSANFFGPFVGRNTANGQIYYNPFMELLDILYDDMTISKEIYTDKIPVGLCVIPSDFLPDRKARILSLLYITSSSTQGSSTGEVLDWGPSGTNTPLNNFNRVSGVDTAATGNYDGTTITSNDKARLPYDSSAVSSSRIENLVDSGCYWNSRSYSGPYAPSPYIPKSNSDSTRILCSAYADPNGGTNCLSDLDGEANTKLLCSLGSSYAAANACANYIPKDSTFSAGRFYLPSMGELGFVIARAYSINNKLGEMVNVYTTSHVQTFQYNRVYWSSTEYDANYARALSADNGNVAYVDKKNHGSNVYIRAMAKIG